MKQMQTLALALALVALGSVSWAATNVNSSRTLQKKPPDPQSINLNSSRSNIYRVKVTQVNEKDKIFAVEANFSAKNLKTPLPEVGTIIDITYNQPTPGAPPEVTTIKGSKSNSSDRLSTSAPAAAANMIFWPPCKVTQVNAKDKTFAVEVTFSTEELKGPLPEVGANIDVTYTQTTPGGRLRALTFGRETLRH